MKTPTQPPAAGQAAHTPKYRLHHSPLMTGGSYFAIMDAATGSVVTRSSLVSDDLDDIKACRDEYASIVRAANNHAALVAALEKCRMALLQQPQLPMYPEFHKELFRSITRPAIDAAAIALAQAKEGQP